jgi:hypothetical protein
MGKVNQEMAEHGDMVMLPVSHSCRSGGEAGGMAASSPPFFLKAKSEGLIACLPTR